MVFSSRGNTVTLSIFSILYYTFVYGVPSPFGSMSQRWFSGFGRKEFGNFRQFKRQTTFVDHIRHSILVVNREWFAPVTLTGEDSVTKTIIHLYASQIMFFYVILGFFDSFFDGQSVQCILYSKEYTVQQVDNLHILDLKDSA